MTRRAFEDVVKHNSKYNLTITMNVFHKVVLVQGECRHNQSIIFRYQTIN